MSRTRTAPTVPAGEELMEAAPDVAPASWRQQVSTKSLVANEPRHKRDAEDSAEESKEDETSAGVWKLDGRATDLERLDDYLAAVGVPFVFKGLARGCLFTTKGLIIILNDRRKTATIISDATTGRRREVYVCDGAAQKVRNGWGNEIAMRASILPGGCLTIENLEPPSLPPRSTVTTRYEPDGAKMVCSIEVRRSEGRRHARHPAAREAPRNDEK